MHRLLFGVSFLLLTVCGDQSRSSYREKQHPFVVYGRSKVCNDLRMCKWRQNLNFWTSNVYFMWHDIAYIICCYFPSTLILYMLWKHADLIFQPIKWVNLVHPLFTYLHYMPTFKDFHFSTFKLHTELQINVDP